MSSVPAPAHLILYFADKRLQREARVSNQGLVGKNTLVEFGGIQRGVNDDLVLGHGWVR